jgi:alpha-D-ribose 1-methylphosphonate 5-triphosphate diphosphatase
MLAGEREVRGWWVTLDGGTIVDVGPRPCAAERYDLGELHLIPGLIDLHSDCLEELAHPRPSAEFALEATFFEYDALLVAWGVTTNYLCLTLDDDARKWRTRERALETERTLRRLHSALRADHRLHLRVDVTSESLDLLHAFTAGGHVSLVSYMDHSPGAGQFATEEAWRTFYGRNSSAEELDRLMLRRLAGRGRVAETRAAIAAYARDLGASLASHDDDSLASVELAAELGVAIAEFPVNAEATAAARARGLGVVMGAPNARRGGSHVDNLSAREALASGWLDALCSDYHPPSLLGAAYALALNGACSWAEALGLVTRGPARIAGLQERGVIAPGMRADLVAIDARGGHPVVRQTWIAGVPALGIAPEVAIL